MSKYPEWICFDCGKQYGRWDDDHLATFHQGECGWCKRKNVGVTQPRDYGWPPHKQEINRRRTNHERKKS